MQRKQSDTFHEPPPVIVMEPHCFCNLTCLSCLTGQGKLQRPAGKMSYSSFKKFVDEVSPWLKAVQWSGMGEPLLYEDSLDSIDGLVLRPSLYKAEREGNEEKPLAEFLIPVQRVSGELPVLRLLDLFIKRKEHMFLVEDEYGQTEGIVTLEDAVETLLGREIMDESDTVEDMQELARSKYRGRLRDAR